ncbi:MAG: TatD family hydrolase [Candidatus Zixiibacteriota bacterium]
MIDSHCHLDFDEFDGCREEIIKEAQATGVHTIINIGVDQDSSRQSLELAQAHEGIYATVGVHPHDAVTFNDEVEQTIKQLVSNEQVVAVGEIGLDFYRNLSPHRVQRDTFCRQLELAVECKKPVVIHSRNSFRETVDIVKEYAPNLVGGVFHCFPGNIDDALKVIESGLVISVGGVITFPNARMAQLAALVPLDKIILETDAPYLTPVPHRGKQNRPAYVKYVYQKLAEMRDMSVEDLEKVVDRTAQKLFGLVEIFEG